MYVYFVYLCTIFLLNFSYSSAQVSEGVPCDTPDQKYGLCINIYNCDVLLNLLRAKHDVPEAREYLRSSTCGYLNNNIPMVCCPQVIATESPPSTPSNNNNIHNNNNNNNNNNIKSKFLTPPNCGKHNGTLPRIVGGQPATVGQFPFIVALGYKSKKNERLTNWLCGGSLITDRHVLTAAHCVLNYEDALHVARIGDLDLYSDNDGATPESIPIVHKKIHEDYSPVKFINDIAILTLEHAPTVPYSPACLPFEEPLRSATYKRKIGIVAGWGSLYFNGPSSSNLQTVQLPVQDTDTCQKAFANARNAIIDNRILCAGYLAGGKDSCKGDSGGPYIYASNYSIGREKYLYQIGVVSYGFKCAEAGYPGVYTRVTAFIDWIARNI